MILETIGHSYVYEMECLARLFFPGAAIEITANPGNGQGDRLTTKISGADGQLELFASVNIRGKTSAQTESFIPGSDDWETPRKLAALLFEQLCAVMSTRPPWGTLTGVRPVSLCRKLVGKFGLTQEELADLLTGGYRVNPDKARLAISILEQQEPILAGSTPDSYSLYVSIPFCPSRCLYCSFVSHSIDKAAGLLPGYLPLLIRELGSTAALADELGLKLKSIYIGGGAPPTLTAIQLGHLLDAIDKNFDLPTGGEYTVEAGRPDSITRDKLDVLRSFGVGRISINPQIMDDKILESIGRKHTVEQVLQAFELARGVGFESINMDLIAGLPGQDLESFVEGVELILTLAPENITVHTLTVKRSSGLRDRADAFENKQPIGRMIDRCRERLGRAGYLPYYLYRQQGTPQNLENIGYSLPGREGLYNIYSMEDNHTILATGAGGVSKLCAPGRVERIHAYKYPYEYIRGFETILNRKQDIARFYGVN